MFHVPEKYRIKTGFPGVSDSAADGNNGAFIIPIKGKWRYAFIIASDGEGWEHVSVHINQGGQDLTPSWDEMCKVKDIFWDAEDCVVQYHPPRSEYVNNHKHTLHL